MRDSLTPNDYDGTTVGTYTYDTRQLRQTGQSINYGSFSLATGTTYNALGQKSSITYPDGAQYSYTYDNNNQLSTVNFPSGFGSITINSYLWTVPAQITLPGGTVRTQQYDGLLRLKTLAVKDPGQSSVMNYQYNYDLTDNITTKTTETGTTNYSYDTLDRLTAAAYTGTTQTNEAYSYDPVANRLTDSHTAATVWSYDANNQLTQVLNGAGTISYSYDANGNTISQSDANGSTSSPQARNYVYDTDNRLIEVRDGSNTLIAAYSYDPFGRRISKDVGTQKTYYLYNDEGLIAEADATGQVTKSYGYAPGSTLRPSSGQAYTTNPLWMKAGTAYYTYQNDHLGTPMKLLSQSGAVVWSATYDAFGKATVNPSSTVTNNLRFPGQYYDQETGLHYNWMRYYDPGTGRYVTSDPIGLMGGINMYAYVGGNPVFWVDPRGLDITYANHEVAAGMYHSLLIITPDNQALYVNDPRFQNFDANGNRFATIGAGPNIFDHLEAGANRPKDVNEPTHFKKKLDLPCQYSDEDAAIQRLFDFANKYNQNKTWYTLLPMNIFGIPTGWNSNSFIAGLGQAAGFSMPAPGSVGGATPGYENPVPAFRFGRH